MKLFIILNMCFLMSSCSIFGVRQTEEVLYSVETKEEDYELRKYPSHIVAEATVDGDFRESQTKAFRILAKYIFGGNKKKISIDMTAPVTQMSKEEIAMTAPVVQFKSPKGWTMSFAMPRKFKAIVELPVPNDPRIFFRKVPDQLYAVVSFSGYLSEGNRKKYAEDLSAWVEKKKAYKTVSEPKTAGYNPPWTLPFLRTNEIMVQVIKKQNE